MSIRAETRPGSSGQPVSDQDYRKISERLFREASLLSCHDYATWLTLLAPEINYRMPLQTFQHRNQRRDYGKDPAWLDETYASLEIRANQLNHAASNSEAIPSFMRYFVTNILIETIDAGFAVSSQVLLIRVRANNPAPFFLSAQRSDIWEKSGELLLLDREIHLDMPHIDSPTIAFFM
ncbi:MAG: aromatic-ring-hydroxylating dioxygenase subunit beta [Immundisolibacteraceae bacterium]|nr:aromatic-ring-hydroxylating dioxygenase subunit beta [Immundisolibacteraceae bacterium]